MATPNPGSHKAVEAGCTCPVVDNSWGSGYHRPADGSPALFVISDDCPLHSGTTKVACACAAPKRELFTSTCITCGGTVVAAPIETKEENEPNADEA